MARRHILEDVCENRLLPQSRCLDLTYGYVTALLRDRQDLEYVEVPSLHMILVTSLDSIFAASRGVTT